MSSSSLSLEQIPPPNLKADDPSAADPARLRLARRTFFSKAFSVRNLTHRQSTSRPEDDSKGKHKAVILNIDEEQPTSPLSFSPVDIVQDSPSISTDDLPDDKDMYRWAIVYENQRGITLFSTPYYSPLSLLPNDPPPFTLPEVAGYSNRQPQLSLSEYPLPDGTWRWVSQSWLIDMREGGEVQYDGFEYNWFFRKHNWRAEVGNLGAGGWVRRRRWVRLMVRPARALESLGSSRGEASLGLSPPSSVRESTPEAGKSLQTGDEFDWEYCHSTMRRQPLDGMKLKLWKQWLGLVDVSEQDTDSIGNVPAKDYVTRILCDHVQDIFEVFVYPDSKQAFLELVARAGVLSNVGSAYAR